MEGQSERPVGLDTYSRDTKPALSTVRNRTELCVLETQKHNNKCMFLSPVPVC